MNEAKYGVWCEVWGGVTGSRESWLKQDGKIVRFATIEQAEQTAAHMRERTGGRFKTAYFLYTAKPFADAA